MVFTFDGEFSVVADPTGGSVDSIVGTVIGNLQAALGLAFKYVFVHSIHLAERPLFIGAYWFLRPSAVLPGPEGSVVAVLSCEYTARVPLLLGQKQRGQRPPATTEPDGASDAPRPDLASDQDTPVEAGVRMAGELRVGVAWDRRHRFFPGQRVLVRFKLVG